MTWVYAGEPSGTAMQQLDVGVVGAGWMATDYHIPAFAAHEATRVVAVAERDAERRAAASDEFGLAGYADADAMLAGESLDVVSICTPPATHRDIFLAAVEAGCHVFCEKPLATDAESAREMQAAADDAGVVTQVGYLHRYYENAKRAATMLDNDILGEIVEARVLHHSAAPGQGWYYNPALSGGGALRDLLPHSLDLCLSLFGEATVERCRTRDIRNRGVEDWGQVGLDAGGVPVDLSVSWTQPDELSQFVVVGTEGWLAFDPETLEGQAHGRPFEFRQGASPLVDIGLTKLYGATEDDAHTERLRDFVDHVVAGDRETAAPVERGVAVAEAIDDAYAMAGDAQ